MANTKMLEKPDRGQSIENDLRLIISLTRSGAQCAEGLVVEFGGIQDLAEALLDELTD